MLGGRVMHPRNFTVAVMAIAVAELVSVAPLHAQPIPSLRGSISGDFAVQKVRNGGPESHSWRGSAEIVNDITPNGLQLQANVEIGEVDPPGDATATARAGVALLMRSYEGVLAAAFDYGRARDGVNVDYTSYGGYAGLNLAHNLTVFGKGGGFNGTQEFDGEYYGAGLIFYPNPNIALTASADRVDLNNFGDYKDYAISAEYLFGWFYPTALFGKYAYSDIPGSIELDTFTMGLRLYLGDDGAWLVEHHRNDAIRDLYMPVRTFGL